MQLAQTFVNGVKVRERTIHSAEKYSEHMRSVIEVYGEECQTTLTPVEEEQPQPSV